jgi:hypothetical protein
VRAISQLCYLTNACRTRELSAELTVTRAYWRKQNVLVCGRILKYLWQAWRKRLKIFPHTGVFRGRIRHEWLSAQQIAPVCGSLFVCSDILYIWQGALCIVHCSLCVGHCLYMCAHPRQIWFSILCKATAAYNIVTKDSRCIWQYGLVFYKFCKYFQS